MKIFRTGIMNTKNSNYGIKRNYSPYCTFQLFHTTTKININGKAELYPPGTIILFSPASKQNFKCADHSFQNSFVVFSATDEEQKTMTFDRPVSVHNSDFFINLLTLIHQEFYASTEHGPALDLLLLSLLEKAKEYLSTVSTPESSEKEITLHNLRTEMLGCAQFDWAINKLAKMCHMSPSRFHVVYKEKYGVSPIHDIRQQRISIAQSLLRTTDKSIQEVSEACGYKSIAYFSRHFKQTTGLSPTDFRKKAL